MTAVKIEHDVAKRIIAVLRSSKPTNLLFNDFIHLFDALEGSSKEDKIPSKQVKETKIKSAEPPKKRGRKPGGVLSNSPAAVKAREARKASIEQVIQDDNPKPLEL